MLEGPGGGFLPHPGRSGGNKLCLPPGSGSRSSTSTRESSDSRPPKTRKFHAGVKIVVGLPSRAPRSHALKPQHSLYPHTKLPTWVELWKHRTAGAEVLCNSPTLGTLGQEGSSPSMCLNTWNQLAVHFNHHIRNRKLTHMSQAPN